MRSKRIAFILVIIGVLGLLLSGLLYISRPKAQPYETIQSIDVDLAPSTVQPPVTEIAKYNVPATLPKYIDIPAIAMPQSRVIQLGLKRSGEIATPSNIFDTGWYSSSAKPGQAGAMFIFGHVSGPKVPGVFANLKKLKSGELIKVTRSDDKVYTYRVISQKVYPYNHVDMRAVLAPVNPRQPGLNLMTCTGKVIAGTHNYNQRLIVFTSLVK
jgi:sortase (surface protein transpeptidase)